MLYVFLTLQTIVCLCIFQSLPILLQILSSRLAHSLLQPLLSLLFLLHGSIKQLFGIFLTHLLVLLFILLLLLVFILLFFVLIFILVFILFLRGC